MLFSVAALALSACAHQAGSAAAASTSSTTGAGTMPDTEVIKPSRFNAEQVLRQLLELIRSSESVEDFTPERLEGMEGGPVKYWEEGFGVGAALTPQWTYVFEAQRSMNALLVTFRFGHTPRTSPPMTDICQLDFPGFVAELEALGYDHEPRYDHGPPPVMALPLPNGDIYSPPRKRGRLLYEYFYRAGGQRGLVIKVKPRGESRENAAHRCVETVWIR